MPALAVQSIPSHTAPPPAPRPRILLVDDDPFLREALALIFTCSGFEVVEAADVPGALKRIDAQLFDALLSDLHMPGPGDGLTVVEAMRGAHPRAVTVLMSASLEKLEARNALLGQADEVLVKPAKLEVLVATVTERLKLEPPRARTAAGPHKPHRRP